MKTRMHRAWKFLIGVAVVLAVAHVVALWHSGRALRRAYADLARDGRPMRPDQVIPPAAPPEQNAAPLYEAARQLLNAERSGETSLMQAVSTAAAAVLDTYPQTNALAKLEPLLALRATREALAIVSRAAQRPSCRFELDYTKGAAMLMPHLSDLRTLSRLQCAMALSQSAAGQADEAWNTLEEGFRHANALHGEPILISQLVRIAQFSLCARTLRLVAVQHPLPPARAAALAACVEQFDDQRPFVASVDGERLLLGEWGFRLRGRELRQAMSWNGDSSASGAWPLMLFFSISTPLNQWDHAQYLALMHGQTRLAAEPYNRQLITATERQMQAIPRYCVLTRLLVPALGAATERFVRLQAEARVTRKGLGLLAWQQTHGTFPAKLEELGTPVPLDPFGGQPLRYRAEGAGFVLYSSGPDLKDDGGSETGGQNKLTPDIVWRHGGK